MAFQTGKTKRPDSTRPTVGAKGNAVNTGAPGPTPAPTYKTPDIAQTRVYAPTYGQNNDPNPSSVAPGKAISSPLADELKRVNAQGDGGDHLQDIIERGTARDPAVDLTGSWQLRTVDKTPYPTTFGHRPANAGGSPSGAVPAKTGQQVTPDPSRTAYDKDNK